MAPDISAQAHKRILIVDDSALIRLYYYNALEKAGFAVEQALNGIEGTEKVLAGKFDLLVVDVNMPGMDGFSFVRALRQRQEDVAGLPVLIISTEAADQDVADALAAGANYYLVKPVSEQDLVRHVSALSGVSP